MKEKIFYAISFGIILGALVRSFLFIDFYLSILFILLGIVLFLFFKFFIHVPWGIVCSIFILCFAVGITRFDLGEKSRVYEYDNFLDQESIFEGQVVDEPIVKDSSIRLVVKLKDSKNKVVITTYTKGNINYGDVLSLSGVLEKPENFVTDQGKIFDYVNYLKKDGILYTMDFAKVEVLNTGQGFWLKRILYKIKNKFLKKTNFAIREPESILLGGLILGERSSFDDKLREDFVRTGTIHIVALSGYNITIVSEWFMKLFAFLPQIFAISMGIFSIILFVLMTGAPSTAVRAGIMAIIALYARATGRDTDAMRILLLAGVIMILFNPFVLVFDVSFQLSFIATVAVIFLAPRLEKYFSWVTKKFKLRDIVTVTFSAYIFVLPFILYKMGNLSIVALPTNLLVLPFIPFTMLFGFVTSFIGFVIPILSVFVGFITELFLKYELMVINFFSNFSFASLSLPNFPLILTILIYVYFIYYLFGRNIKKFFSTF